MAQFDDFIRKEKFTDSSTKKDCHKKQLSFEFDNFKLPRVREDDAGLASLILGLLVMEPGTYPNHPTMGINLPKYQFEQLTSDTIITMEKEIMDGINKWINDANVRAVKVEKMRDEINLIEAVFVGISLVKLQIVDGNPEPVTESMWFKFDIEDDKLLNGVVFK